MNEKWVDYYEALELEFGCSEEDIKKNYRELMKKYHPDSKFADEVKTKEVNEAYEVLGDSDKRAKYDETYFQCKNGEFDNQEAEEMPKYSHEEMHQTFKEEEIRFAKRVALQKVISETLDNAKVIIDAKNELLFAAFNEAYDNETYRIEYKQFCEISKDFINNLNDLIFQAESYGLESEINTISEVMSFLNEVIESIPKSLEDAKRTVKIEIMKEQLQNEAKEIIQNAESIRSEFIGLYSKAYRENISEEDFKTCYDVLKFSVNDAISQLEEIYDLLKEADLNEVFAEVGLTIGKLKQDLETCSGKYKVALMIGKRENIRQRVEATMLSFEEYKAKMLEIMQDIIQNPESDNLSLLVTKARSLSNEFDSSLPLIDEKDLENSEFSETANDHYSKAKDIYTRGSILHDKLTKIFAKAEKKDISNKKMSFLREFVQTTEEEIDAIKLLHDVYILSGEHEEYQNLKASELKKLREIIKNCREKSENLQNLINEMFEYIDQLTRVYSTIENYDLESFAEKQSRYENLIDTLAELLFISFFGIPVYGIMSGCSAPFIHKLIEGAENGNHILHSVFFAASVLIPLISIINRMTKKCNTCKEIKEIVENYKQLMSGNDQYLHKLYQRAENI